MTTLLKSRNKTTEGLWATESLPSLQVLRKFLRTNEARDFWETLKPADQALVNLLYEEQMNIADVANCLGIEASDVVKKHAQLFWSICSLRAKASRKVVKIH